jgi:hypothetical protein
VTHTFPNKPPGTYVVGGEDRQVGRSARQTVRLANADVDVTLTLRPNVSVGGMVWTEGGGAVALDGVRVRLEAEDHTAEAAVKADGTFTVQRVQPMVYGIRVTVPAGGYLKSLRMGERVLSSPRVDLSKSKEALAIVLGTDGARLTGTTAEGAVVVAAPEARLSEWADLVRSAAADKDGRFELRDLAPGDYRVLAFADAEEGAPLDADFRRPFVERGVVVRVGANAKETVQVRAISMYDAR